MICIINWACVCAHEGTYKNISALTTWASIRFFSCIWPTGATTLWILTISLFTFKKWWKCQRMFGEEQSFKKPNEICNRCWKSWKLSLTTPEGIVVKISILKHMKLQNCDLMIQIGEYIQLRYEITTWSATRFSYFPNFSQQGKNAECLAYCTWSAKRFS